MLSLAQNRVATILLAITFLVSTAVAVVAQGTSVTPTQVITAAPAPVKVKYNPVDNAELVYVSEGSIKRISLIAVPSGPRTVTASDIYNRKEGTFSAAIDGFWIYQKPITVAQYRYFCQITHRDMPEEPFWKWQENHPIVNVTWDDAADYAKWAGAALPTVAQWQLAGYGTDGRRYPWGDKLRIGKWVFPSSTKPVGSTPADASPYGVLDSVPE